MAKEKCSATVSSQQEPASAVAGNIGILKAKVLVWDHDPFLARPFQQTAFPFSENTASSVDGTLTNGVEFSLNSVYLKPNYVIQDMFVGTRNKNVGDSAKIANLDLVGATSSSIGFEASSRLPGGFLYDGDNTIANILNAIRFGKIGTAVDSKIRQSMFPHQLWLYEGSLLKKGVPVHPSEYTANLSEIGAAKTLVAIRDSETNATNKFSKFTVTEIQSAPKWDYVLEYENGVSAICPTMISKQVPDLTSPVHWTLTKFTPLFQGEDFFVTIKLGQKRTDDAVDESTTDEIVDTNWEEYKFLIYNPKTPPSNSPGGTGEIGFVQGISNAAFTIVDDESKNASSTQTVIDKKSDASRQIYWWKYKTYILIEVGVGHYDHNYFIEIVKGRNPRFLHLGEEWDNPDRLQTGVSLDPAHWFWMRKCRVLSSYAGVSSDELFQQESFRVTVRNHLGSIVITFSGYESEPWVISRLDNDPTKFNFDKVQVPAVVPAAAARIHGGNISCSVNFSVLQYTHSAIVPFLDRQADTHLAEDKDLYMTLSNMGVSNLYTNTSITKKLFNDKRFGFSNIGYDCDAYSVRELIKNQFTTIPIYEYFENQYRKYGKGWILDVPLGADGLPSREENTGLFKSHRLKTGLKDGNRHRIKIFNYSEPNSSFAFGLSGASDANYPYKEYASRWNVGVKLIAGTVTMPAAADGEIVFNSQPAFFKNCVTPIVNSWRMVVLGGGKAISGNVEPFDISSLISSIHDSWSAEGFTTINHEMQVRCYIPQGIPVGGDDNQLSNNTDIHSIGQRLVKLHDKSFYVTVSYWWENGVGKRHVEWNELNNSQKSLDSTQQDLMIAMTGVVFGAELEKSVNKIYMNFTVKDYMSIMQKQFVFNSPFFDGVSDAVAVHELAKMAGFDDSTEKSTKIDRRPLGYLQKIITEKNRLQENKFIYNGEESRSIRYDLPGSYADLANPSIRFQNGETYESALKKIAQLGGKTIYFDRWGVLRLESIPAMDAAFDVSVNAGFNDLVTLDQLISSKFRPVFRFVTTPFFVARDGSFVFNPKQHAAHLVYEVVKYSRSVEDCVNQIIILSASNNIQLSDGTKTGGLIVEGYTFFEQIWKPESEGFLGFRKPFYQANGIFGGVDAVRKAIQTYSRFKFPPVTVSFQTFGIPGLKALDIIALDDDLLYITEISHELTPESNKWWMNITGEWLKPFSGDLGFLQEHESDEQ